MLTEANAILAYIGAAHGGEDSEDYGRDGKLGRKEAELLSYLTSEVHAAYAGHFAPGSFAETKDAQEQVKAATYGKLAKHYDRLNEQVANSGSGWLLHRKSYADAYLYIVCRWIDQTPLKLADYPALADHVEAMEADDKVLEALERQGMTPRGKD